MHDARSARRYERWPAARGARVDCHGFNAVNATITHQQRLRSRRNGPPSAQLLPSPEVRVKTLYCVYVVWGRGRGIWSAEEQDRSNLALCRSYSRHVIRTVLYPAYATRRRVDAGACEVKDLSAGSQMEALLHRVQSVRST